MKKTKSFSEDARYQDLLASKLARIINGEEIVLGDWELDKVGGHLPDDVVVIPNPAQCGIRDRYLAGKIDCPRIAAFRQQHGLIDDVPDPAENS